MKENDSISLPPYLQIRDENPDHKRGVIPIGPHFQVNLPAPVDNESDTSRWLGTQVWPLKTMNHNKNNDAVGRGRNDACDCQVPGSFECVKGHVYEQKMRLQKELGPAYNDWKFDQMGDDVAKDWTLEERKTLESIVKRSKTFMDSALKALPKQNRETIANYYFNIIVPRRIGLKTRTGFSPADINTDNDEEAYVDKRRTRASSSGSSRTRKRSVDDSEAAGRRYLKGLR